MAVNYDAGRGGRGAYANLAKALQSKLDAENTREAEDIRRRGLFGSGITQENLQGLARTGLGIAQFGQDRMDKQRADATDSFNRRMERNQKLYNRYASSDRPSDQKRADMLLLNMNREQDRFEDAMRKYSKSGMFGTGFGSDVVDYDVDESGFLQKMYNRANKRSGPPPLEVQNLSPSKKPGVLQEQTISADPTGSGRSFYSPTKRDLFPSGRASSQPSQMKSPSLNVQDLTPSPKPSTFTELEMAPIKNKQYTASSPAEDEAIRNRNAMKYADDITSAYDPNYVSQNYDPTELDRIRKRALMQGY